MSTVAVHEVQPVSRHGLVTALQQAGFAPIVPDSMRRWASRAVTGSSAVVCVRESSDADLVATIGRDRSDLAVVVLCNATPERTFEALLHGASSVLSFATPVETIPLAVRMTQLGLTVLPNAACACELADRTDPRRQAEVDDETCALLRQLASGAAVPDIAESQGYSTREMFRRLKALYRRAGVTNRSQILVWAGFYGIVSPDNIADGPI